MIRSLCHHLRCSLNARIFWSMLMLLASTTMALNYYLYVRSSEELRDEMIQHSQSMARILASNSRLAVFTGDKKALASTVTLMAEENDFQAILFLDQSGIELFNHARPNGSRTMAGILNGQKVIQQITDHGPTPSFFFAVNQDLVMVEPVMASTALSSEELFFPDAAPDQLASKQKAIGYVALTVSTASHQRKVRAKFLRDTATTLAITLLSCLITFAVIHFLTIPLRQLTAEILRNDPAANNPGNGQAPRRNDFKHMIATIRESFNTINDLKNTLEEKVKDRTRQLAVSNQDLIIQKNGLTAANQKLATTLSQLQSTQAQLVHSEKMAALGMLIAGLSHEIKNSINFIACSVPLLKKVLASSLAAEKDAGSEVGTPANKAMALLANIQEGVDRTVQVIDDLAHFCHDNEAGFSPTDIHPGLKASIAILRHEFDKRIEIIEELAPDLPLVRGRAGQLNQVFINILINAAQAILGRGTIEVKTWAGDCSVHVAISDSGQGIRKQILGKIYDPFFTTKEVGQGTGLGLSISYNIIKNHGGNLKVNTIPGAGTTFEIVLPATPIPAASQGTLSA